MTEATRDADKALQPRAGSTRAAHVHVHVHALALSANRTNPDDAAAFADANTLDDLEDLAHGELLPHES